MNDVEHVSKLRSLISEFIRKRLDDKLAKLPEGDSGRERLAQQFITTTWLDDAARRVRQIQAVTHANKATHPGAQGSSIYVNPLCQPALGVVGTHCLQQKFAIDVVGNAAALDVYKFLKLEFRGKTLLALAITGDSRLQAALSTDSEQAQQWMEAFATLVKPRGQLSSHTLSKQLLWFVGNDPHADSEFHVLAPLFASSLTHRVFEQVQTDRYGEAARAAREARRNGEHSETRIREYPNLAIQKLGGTKPQNISQLNSERGGQNLLFASLPPVWKQADIKPLLRVKSMFMRYQYRVEVRQALQALRIVLKVDASPNHQTRSSRDAWIDELIDSLLRYSAELRTLSPGWSQAAACELSLTEQHWLDPIGVVQPRLDHGLSVPSDTEEQVAAGFARWLNSELGKNLDVGDVEFDYWRKRCAKAINSYDWKLSDDN